MSHTRAAAQTQSHTHVERKQKVAFCTSHADTAAPSAHSRNTYETKRSCTHKTKSQYHRAGAVLRGWLHMEHSLAVWSSLLNVQCRQDQNRGSPVNKHECTQVRGAHMQYAVPKACSQTHSHTFRLIRLHRSGSCLCCCPGFLCRPSARAFAASVSTTAQASRVSMQIQV